MTRAVRLRLRAVPTVLVYSSARGLVTAEGGIEEQDVRETVLAFHYSAQVVGEVGPAEVSGGIVGRADDVTPFETVVGSYEPVTLSLGATVGGLPVRPGVTVRVPLLNGPFATDAVVGLSLDVPIR